MSIPDEDSKLAPRQIELSDRPDNCASAVIASEMAHTLPINQRSVLDGMSEGFALLDAEFRVIDVNAETLRLESRTRADMIGHSHWELYPGSELGPLGHLYKKAMRERLPVSLEHRHVWGDGRVSWLDMRAYPVEDDKLAIFFRDISARKVAEEQLRISEQRFHGAIEAVADVLWTNDAIGRMVGEQPGWAALTGQGFDEYQGYGWSKAVHPDDAQPTVDAWEQAVAEKRLFAFEHRVRRHDGAWRCFSIRAVPVLADDGTVREWVGVHTDITDTRENDTRLRQLTDTITDVFYVHELDEGLISYVSPAYERIWESTAETLYADARAFIHTIHPDDRWMVEEAIARRLQGENTETRYRLLFPDGRVRHIHDRAFFTRNPIHGTPRVVGIAEDVTVTTEARLELARTADSLRQALADKDVLMREIDHRVRNSLSLVSALLSMQGARATSTEVKHALTAAATRIRAVARVHERLYRGKQVGAVRFDEYLAEICSDLQASHGNDGVRIKLSATPLTIAVDDAIPLGLITNELVTNALKHCSDEDVQIEVTLTSDPEGHILTIADNGAGMPADFAKDKGAGLGMQVVTQLSEQIGGRIELPEPSAPAHFKIVIPAKLIVKP